MRVRGLKLKFKATVTEPGKSHPVRVRGLKRPTPIVQKPAGHVAPRAGAWIETLQELGIATGDVVAPRAGAWIETLLLSSRAILHKVAPRAGAWIETDSQRPSLRRW